MDRYLLMTSVTSQEEKAVRELYRDKNWVLYRYEIKDLEITCDCGQKLDLDVLLKLETSKLRCDSEDFTTVEDWTGTGNKVTLEIKEQRSCPRLDLDHTENSISDVISVNTTSDKNQPNEYGTDVREEEVTCTHQIDGFNKHFHEDTKQQSKSDQQLKSDQVSSNLGKTHSRGQKNQKELRVKKRGWVVFIAMSAIQHLNFLVHSTTTKEMEDAYLHVAIAGKNSLLAIFITTRFT